MHTVDFEASVVVKKNNKRKKERGNSNENVYPTYLQTSRKLLGPQISLVSTHMFNLGRVTKKFLCSKSLFQVTAF